MEMNEHIKKIILDFHTSKLKILTTRSYDVTFVKDMSFSITGPRRCGKSYRTYQFINEYISKGNKKNDICYIQFNDNKLKSINSEDLNIIDEAYFSLYPNKQNKTEVVFIFDEIHRIDGWEDYILYLLHKSYKVIITGSTSKLLQGKIAPSLRGKIFNRELLPFSFTEFARHYNVKTKKLRLKDEVYIKNLYDKYLEQGGLPGLLDIPKWKHIETFNNYWDTMLLRDVVEAQSGTKIDIMQLELFAQYLIDRVSCPMTVRKIIDNMRSNGISISQEKGYKYLSFLEEAYLIFKISFYSQSEKIRNRNHDKIYVVDWNLANCISSICIDITRIFEDLIFIELRRRGLKISYYKTREGYEIDFVTQDKYGKQQPDLYQVSYELSSEEVLEREIRSIVKSYKFLNAKSATIITHSENKVIKIDDEITINVIPAWKWLLND